MITGMIPIEICIECDTLVTLRESVRSAFVGGASRIELCRDMAMDGLTPSREDIEAAREIFIRPGVMAMIRPRAGDFYYTSSEIKKMQQHIDMAASAGADGVVFGALNRNRKVDIKNLGILIDTARSKNLSVTFHRAFDAVSQPLPALHTLIDLGVDRILTSGIPWGHSGTALDGKSRLQEIIAEAADRIEIIIAGGVSPHNAGEIVTQLSKPFGRISLHAYSGVRKKGLTDIGLVQQLVSVVGQYADPPPLAF